MRLSVFLLVIRIRPLIITVSPRVRFEIISSELCRVEPFADVQFRSAVLFGPATLCTGEEQLKGLKAITNEIWRNVPYDRWENCRKPDTAELKATKVIKMVIEHASAKIGDSHVEDEQKDIDAHKDRYWAVRLFHQWISVFWVDLQTGSGSKGGAMDKKVCICFFKPRQKIMKVVGYVL